MRIAEHFQSALRRTISSEGWILIIVIVANYSGITTTFRQETTDLDGHVGNGEQIVELDAECFVQLLLVLGLERRLRKDRIKYIN